MLSPNNPLTDEKLNRTKKGNVESNRFKKLRRSDPESIHEVTIAVKQKNLDIISDMLTERSQPGNPNYQNWLSFSEVHSIIRNDEAVSAIQSWVKNFGGTVLFVTPHGDYIRAAAPVSTWERVFDTQFYVWESIKSTESAASSSSDRLKKKMFYHRAESYTIPDPLRKHISAVFQTTQAPVVPRRHGQRRPYQPTNPIDVSNSQNKSDVSLIPAYVAYGLTGDSRPASLNQMYGITSNTGN